MWQKKSIKAVELKRPSTISRLIKCYVCNMHFDNQAKFDLHLKQHQNKLNRTNLDDIQRKTQESFNKKKYPSNLNKTQKIQRTRQESEDKDEKEIPDTQEPFQEETEEQQVEEALRESQILLQKIEFMTQVPSQTIPDVVAPKEQESEKFQKTIKGEKRLFELIKKSSKESFVEKLILETEFENKSFENYQEQLLHLRLLSSIAVTSESVSKILKIRSNICRDICKDLENQFQDKNEQIQSSSASQEPKLVENLGEVRFCIDCLADIGVGEEMFDVGNQQFYHKACLSGLSS